MCIFISVSLLFVPFSLSPCSIYKIKHDIKYRSDCSQIYFQKCNIIPTNTQNIPNTITRNHRRMCMCIGWLLVWLVFVCNVCEMHIMGDTQIARTVNETTLKFFCDVIHVRLVCVWKSCGRWVVYFACDQKQEKHTSFSFDLAFITTCSKMFYFAGRLRGIIHPLKIKCKLRIVWRLKPIWQKFFL